MRESYKPAELTLEFEFLNGSIAEDTQSYDARVEVVSQREDEDWPAIIPPVSIVDLFASAAVQIRDWGDVKGFDPVIAALESSLALLKQTRDETPAYWQERMGSGHRLDLAMYGAVATA